MDGKLYTVFEVQIVVPRKKGYYLNLPLWLTRNSLDMKHLGSIQIKK